MIKELKLPEIAENVETATVLTLLVSEGDTIEKDQNVAEMESDKATFDLPSEIAGKVKEIRVKEGEDVNVGDVVMTIETDGAEGKEEKEEADKEEKEKEKEEKEQQEEEKEEEKKSHGKEQDHEKEEEETGEQKDREDDRKEKEDEEPGKAEKKEEEAPAKETEEKEEEKEKAEEKKPRGDIAASPSVRRLAREVGVDIHEVEGTGPHNRITADDVKSYAREAVKKSGGKTGDEYELPDFTKWGDIEKKPLDSIRRRTAKNVTASWQSTPHVFHFDKADVTELEEFRKKYGKEVEKEGGKLTVTAILLKITGKALEAFPKFNASIDLDNEQIIYKKYIHIGVAVDTERVLLVPVIRDVDKKTIMELSVELGEIAEAARNKKIKPDQLQGGNMAISNLGGIGGTGFTPIIYGPNAAILGVSRTTTEPVFVDGVFKPRMMLPLTLSYDHRLIDGAEAARFLRWMCEALENPLLTMFKKA